MQGVCGRESKQFDASNTDLAGLEMSGVNVVILGAGNAGKYLYSEISKKAGNKINVLGFGDNFLSGEYDGIKIESPREALGRTNGKVDAVFIAAGSQKTINVMVRTAMSFQVGEIYMLHDIAGKCHLSPIDENGNIVPTRLRKIRFSPEKPTIPYFEVPITDRCNLNCRGCLFGCSSLAQGGDLPADQIKSDAARMGELLCDVPWIRILGGEPLMHPELPDILRAYRQIFPDSEIDLCTNGILIPKMQADFFKGLEDERISIHISEYPLIHRMRESIEDTLQSYNVEYVFLNRDSFTKYYTLEANNDAASNHEMCFASGCPELYNGRLMRCSAVLCFEKFNDCFDTQFKLLENEDFIDIHGKMAEEVDINEWMNHASHICSYCDIENMEEYAWKNGGDAVALEDYVLETISS